MWRQRKQEDLPLQGLGMVMGSQSRGASIDFDTKLNGQNTLQNEDDDQLWISTKQTERVTCRPSEIVAEI